MKNIFKIFLIAILTIAFSFNTVFADDIVYTDGPFNYVLNDDGSIKIINYFGNDTEVEIPRAIGLYEIDGQFVPRYVTIIAATTFEEVKPTKVIIPDTVIYIEEGAIDSGVTVQYSDESGNLVKAEDANPIIIKPNENPINNNNNEDLGEEFEEIGTEIDPETGEEKNIFEITEGDQNKENNTVIERKGHSTADFDTITISPFGYVLFAAIVCIIAYSFIKKRKNNNIKKVKTFEIEKHAVEENKPPKKRKTTNKKSSTSKKKSATKTKTKRNSSKM